MSFVLKNIFTSNGFQESNSLFYLNCILDLDDSNNNEIYNKILNIESKYLKNENFISNIKNLSENKKILRLRIKKIKKNIICEMEYKNINKYLKTIYSVNKDDLLTINFELGNFFKRNYDNLLVEGLQLNITKVIFE